MRTTADVRLLTLGFVASALLGCSGGGMAWQTILKSDAPGAFAARGDETWLFREKPVMRRAKDGTYTRVELCAQWNKAINQSDLGLDTDLAFEGAKVVWAMCGNTSQQGQWLVRHDGEGTAQRMPLPIDGVLVLVPLLEGAPMLMGQHDLWAFEGGGWVSKGSHPEAIETDARAPATAAGRNTTEVYLQGGKGLHWFNGTTWAPVAGVTYAEGVARPVPMVRFGKVLLGADSLSAGALVPFTLASQASLDEKKLRAVTLVTADTAFIVNASLTEYYAAKSQDPAPMPLGIAPVKGPGPGNPDIVLYDVFGNAYEKKGYMEDSSGVTGVFPVDLNTVLIGYTGGVGLSGGAFRVDLIEGKR